MQEIQLLNDSLCINTDEVWQAGLKSLLGRMWPSDHSLPTTALHSKSSFSIHFSFLLYSYSSILSVSVFFLRPFVPSEVQIQSRSHDSERHRDLTSVFTQISPVCFHAGCKIILSKQFSTRLTIAGLTSEESGKLYIRPKEQKAAARL